MMMTGSSRSPFAVPVRLFLRRGQLLVGSSSSSAIQEGGGVGGRERGRHARAGEHAQAAADHLRSTLQRNSLADIPSALIDKCGPGTPTPAPPGATVKAGNLQLDVRADGSLAFSAVDSGKAYFAATPAFAPSVVNASYLLASLDVAAGDATERIFGLGQGNWTQEGGCPNWPSAHKCDLSHYSACLYFGALGTLLPKLCKCLHTLSDA